MAQGCPGLPRGPRGRRFDLEPWQVQDFGGKTEQFQLQAEPRSGAWPESLEQPLGWTSCAMADFFSMFFSHFCGGHFEEFGEINTACLIL